MRFRVLATNSYRDEWGPTEVIEEMPDGRIARFRYKKHAVVRMPGRLEDAHLVPLPDLDRAGVRYRVSEILEAPEEADLVEMWDIWEAVDLENRAQKEVLPVDFEVLDRENRANVGVLRIYPRAGRSSGLTELRSSALSPNAICSTYHRHGFSTAGRGSRRTTASRRQTPSSSRS